MDQLLLENFSLINKIKEEYDDLLKENKTLKEKILALETNCINENKKLHFYDTNIPEEIIYKFGDGPIRYCENGIYYHGVGINESSWNTNNKFDKCFFVYHSGRKKLPRKDIDTYEPNSFCCNCSYNVELSKRRPKIKIYSCLGHKI